MDNDCTFLGNFVIFGAFLFSSELCLHFSVDAMQQIKPKLGSNRK